jgi:hypothetical protein
LQGFDCSLLTEHSAKGFQIIGRRKAELFSGKRTCQRFGRKTQAGSNWIGHRASLHHGADDGILALAAHDLQGRIILMSVLARQRYNPLRGRFVE